MGRRFRSPPRALLCALAGALAGAGLVPVALLAAATPARAALSGNDDTVYAFGSAAFRGSTSGAPLASPVVGMAQTPDGGGYYEVAQDGGVFTFGGARFYGSTGAQRLNAPIVGMAAAPDGGGYWLVAQDGGVFAFGSARFAGSTGGQRLNAPVVGMAADGTGGGYWLAAQDGGVFTFGDARFRGSAAGLVASAKRVVQITGMPAGDGYRLLALDRPGDVALVGPGSRGPGVVDLQSRLLALAYWLPGANGVFDLDTQMAVYAFQKENGLPRTGVVDAATRDAFRDARRPLPASTGGYTVEVDKAKQVVIVASGGRAQWIFNASSGSDHPYTLEGVRYSAHTPEGSFTVVRAVNGVDISPLGELYRPRYFTWSGIAIHGYSDVPPFPASHGCVRVSNAAIDFFWANDLLPIGASVWVY